MERLVVWHRLTAGDRDDADDEPLRRAAHRVLAAHRAAGADVVAALGPHVVVAYDAVDVRDTLDLLLGLTTELETAGRDDVRTTVGIAVGELDVGPDGQPWGAVLDVAARLAMQAEAGDIVLDATARRFAEDTFLFAPHGPSDAGNPPAHRLDRAFPYRASCRPAVATLGEPEPPPVVASALEPLIARARSGAGGLLWLRGSSVAGARLWLHALARAHPPSLLLRLEPVPGGLEPRGSLRLALCRHLATNADASAADRDPDLLALSRGEALDGDRAAAALGSWLRSVARGPRCAWILLDPVAHIDAASLDTLAACLRSGAPVLVVGRLRSRAAVPASFAEIALVGDVTLPALSPADAQSVVHGMLGTETDVEVVRRVAALGGPWPEGLVEATRTLVASGDLVRRGEGFVWRATPRLGNRPLPLEALLEERVGGLPADALRTLEIGCVLPGGSPRADVEAIAALEGLGGDAVDSGLRALATERFIDDAWQAPTPASSALRAVVLQRMPPSRLAELYRRVAQVLWNREAGSEPRLSRATAGWYLLEAGDENLGLSALLDAADVALEAGLTAGAVRLAAAVVERDSTGALRDRVARLTRASTRAARRVGDGHGTSPSGSGERTTARGATAVEPGETPTDDPREYVVRCLLARDLDGAERWLDRAIAEGRDRAAADRLRAIVHALRGEMAIAYGLLARTL
ncbi:MAG: hypothetical protein NZ898_10475, partial [Myxococcota bacterium]|nr:hypothetical protein [Myxococcota bacterium]